MSGSSKSPIGMATMSGMEEIVCGTRNHVVQNRKGTTPSAWRLYSCIIRLPCSVKRFYANRSENGRKKYINTNRNRNRKFSNLEQYNITANGYITRPSFWTLLPNCEKLFVTCLASFKPRY